MKKILSALAVILLGKLLINLWVDKSFSTSNSTKQKSFVLPPENSTEKEMLENATKADTATCYYNIESGIKDFKGFVKLCYPCSWKPFNTLVYDTSVNIICQFINQVHDDLVLIVSVASEPIEEEITPLVIHTLTDSSFYSQTVPNGTIISSYKKITVDGIKTDEMITQRQKGKYSDVGITHHIIYKKQLITLTYQVTSINLDKANSVLRDYHLFFGDLFNKTEFIK
ncbi:MAG: hypothetical protein ABI402_17305 [Ferruginibacter sp.]